MNLKTVGKLLILPLVGVLLMGLPFVVFFKSLMAPDIAAMQAPGTAEFMLPEEQTIVVWRKVAGVSDDNEFRVVEKELPPGLSIVIKDADSGTTVTLREYLGASTSGTRGTKTSLVKADLPPGTYQLIAKTAGDTMDLVVTPQIFTWRGFVMIFAFNILGGLVFLAGIIYAIRVGAKYLRRTTPAA